MIQRFTTRPEPVEAIRFNGTDACIRELTKWAGDIVGDVVCNPKTGRAAELEIRRVVDPAFRITSVASIGDWVVRHRGQYFVYNDSDFVEKFQAVYEKNH